MTGGVDVVSDHSGEMPSWVGMMWGIVRGMRGMIGMIGMIGRVRVRVGSSSILLSDPLSYSVILCHTL